MTTKSITAGNRAGGGEALSVLLAAIAALVFAGAQTAQAGRPWSGNGTDNNWTTDGNWAANDTSLGDGRFFRSSVQPYSNKTVNFSDAVSYNYDVYVDDGTTEAAPIVWQADQSSFGLQSSKNIDIGCAVADGYLKILNGTYSCYKVHLGKGGFTGMLTMDGGSFTNSNDMYVGDTGTGSLIVNNGATVSVTGKTYVGNASVATGTITVNGGTFTTAENVYIGYNGTGTLTINGGTFETSPAKYTRLLQATSTINLNGGTLKTKHIEPACADSGVTVSSGGTLVFNGGTLYANNAEGDAGGLIRSGVTVRVAAGGAIDSGGRDVTVGAALGVSGDTGGMTFKGGGSVTLSASPAYTGVTTVEVGTALVVPAAIPGGQLAFTVPVGLADGLYPVVTISGDGEFATNVLDGKGEGFFLSCDKKVVYYKSGYVPNQWVGGLSGNLTDAANWLMGVPGAGEVAIVNCSSAASLAVPEGATFSPSSITFAADSAKVTIAGPGAIEGIAAITNHASVAHVFNCEVSGDTIDFYNDSMRCEFRGGITVVTPTTSSPDTANARALVGDWRITGETWTPVGNNYVGHDDMSGSSVAVEGQLLNSHGLSISECSVVTAATLKVTASQNLASSMHGRLVVTGLVDIANTSTAVTFTKNDTESTLVAGGIAINTGNGSFPVMNVKTLVLGGDGIVFGNNANIKFQFPANVTICARDDGFAFGAAQSGTDQRYGIGAGVTLDTTKFETADVPATITVDGKFVNHSSSGSLVVKGCGTVVFNNAASGFDGGVTVTDTATLMVNAGCKPGGGDVAVCSGATLRVAGAGTASVGGLMLRPGSTLEFNFTERRAAPVLNLQRPLYEFTVPLRACSFNIRCVKSEDTGDKSWSTRKAALVALVKSIAPDVIGFQEVTDSQRTYLMDNLSGAGYSFVSRMSGQGECGMVGWRTARLAKKDAGTFWLSTTPDKQSKSFGSDYYRICTWALFTDAYTGKQFCFANTHLDLVSEARPKQMQVIMNQLSRYFDNGVPFVLTGDMNAQETEGTIATVAYAHLNDACLVSKATPTGPWRTYNGWSYKAAAEESSCADALNRAVSNRNPYGGKRIDFMLTSRNVGVASFAIRNDTQPGKSQYPSDHFPIVGNLLVPASDGGGKYTVKVNRSCPHVSAGRYVLTQGAKLENADNIYFDLPRWVERAAVEDGEIVIYTKPAPFRVILR